MTQAKHLCSLSAHDLRIGNWVYDGIPMQVVAIGKDWAHLDFPGNEGGVWEADIKDLQPIKLIEEFFTRNGFIEQVGCDEYGTYFRSVDLHTEVFESTGGWSVHIDDDHFMSVFGKCIKYVHEFQNAYYVSTGKELEVKL
jgi:hypothetical protein